jgi:hypothetical protein
MHLIFKLLTEHQRGIGANGGRQVNISKPFIERLIPKDDKFQQRTIKGHYYDSKKNRVEQQQTLSKNGEWRMHPGLSDAAEGLLAICVPTDATADWTYVHVTKDQLRPEIATAKEPLEMISALLGEDFSVYSEYTTKKISW